MNEAVLLFSGAFDPITSGHMLMLELCIKTNFFKEIRVMPTGMRVDKQYKCEDFHRRKMCEIAMEELKKDYANSNLKFSDYEMNLTSPQDSYDTVKHFQDTEPDKTFYFFMGSDILPEMFLWPKTDQLVDIVNFLIGYRQDYEIKGTDLNKLKSYKLLDNLLSDAGQLTESSSASSTEVRRRLRNSEQCGDLLLHREVSKYVLDNGLYASKPDANKTQ